VKGLAKVYHAESIEPEDLRKLYTSLTLSPDTSEGLLHKCWFDVMFFSYAEEGEKIYVK
jgi:hypothetical protein